MKDDVMPSTSQSKRPRQSTEEGSAMEISNCLICGRDSAAERVPMQAISVGCETQGYPHWTRQQCLQKLLRLQSRFYCQNYEQFHFLYNHICILTI
jgi:hypothetical protein